MSKRPSGYTAFCYEWKSSKEKQGHRFNNIKEVVGNEDCFQDWKDLSEDVKDYYRLLAKCDDHHSKVGERGRKKSSSESRSSSHHSKSRRPSYSRSSASRAAQSKPELPICTKKFKGTMEEYLELLMDTKKQLNCVQNLTFYLVHANYLYVREMDNGNSDYYPVEVAVAECSLEYGVQRVHHVMVKEDIFKGYRNDALVRSAESHKIPIDFNWGKVEVETDYSQIFQGICNFIEPGSIDGELPPLFTMRSNDDHIWRPAKSILGRLALADYKHPNHLLLYSYEELFAFITNAVMRRDKSEFDIAQAIDRLEKDPNAHRNGFGCEFHRRETEGEIHCSSSFVKRWWYRLCEYSCEPLGIEKIPGHHCPAEIEAETFTFTKMSLKPGFNSRDSKDQKRYFKYK